ncbi:MAG TPA: protein translocase subunit SecD [Candidatus Pacearchaeota archaeon]|nr:protein translocase subunit SecD [Candidatus Pacearchaeota archaeon]
MNYYRITVVLIFVMALALGAFVYPMPFSNFVDIPKVDFRLGLDLQGGTQLVYQADLSDVDESERNDRMNGLRDLIERRINYFGVSEPLVQVKGDRLVVELAGVVDPVEAIKMIGETPFLEFKELSTEEDITPEILEIIEEKNKEALEKAESVFQMILDGADFEETAKEYSDDFLSAQEGGSLGSFKKGDMVSEFDEAVFSLNAGEIYESIVETDFGYHIIKKDEDENEEGEIKASHILIKKAYPQEYISEWKRTELSGEHLKTARYFFDQNTRDIIIELDFTSEGGEIFEKITERNIGKPLAIFLDGMSIIDTNGDGEITDDDLYAPTIQEKISGGKAIITGEADLDTVRQIVTRLRSGALPVPIELLNYQNVGPTMGMESLEKSLVAGFWGFLAIVLFIIAFYRLPGLLAAISLICYTIFVLVIFKLLPVTLTLSGIAGFILSIGMAVDANILVFSRMKEELDLGKSLKDSIDIGFERTWPSIRDGNFTTLIVAFILFFVGTSFVQGFAFTLIIGILVSLFAALVITRSLLKSFEGTRFEKINWLWKKK